MDEPADRTCADGDLIVWRGCDSRRPDQGHSGGSGWCPYCNLHLQDLHTVEPKIVALGYQVLFLSTDRPELLYHILSNSKVAAAHAFGVAYRLDAETLWQVQTAWAKTVP